MVVVYKGDFVALGDALRRAEDCLNKEYEKILGEKLYGRLLAVSEKVLKPSSFYSAIDAYAARLNSMPRQDFDTAIAYASDFALDEKGALKNTAIRSAPVFFTLPQQADERILLLKYVHAFNKYLFYAVQEPPLNMAVMAIQANVPFPISLDMGSMASSLSRLAAQEPQERLSQYVDMFMTSLTCQDYLTSAVDIMDNLVLEPFSIKRPLPWRHQKREYRTLVFPGARVAGVIPSSGDTFYGMRDMQAINESLNWQRNGFNTGGYAGNLIQSMKSVHTQRLPISELLEK